jgi:glutamate carboxypeptidase
VNDIDPLTRLPTYLRSRQQEMVQVLAALVSSESPSNDPERLRSTADLVAAHGSHLLGISPDRLGSDDFPALRWDIPPHGSGGDPVVLLAHLDTVWPAGTLQRWPFSIVGDRASGPGAFDMKAGLVQALFALSSLLEAALPRPPIVLLITADEEIGSPQGRALIESTAGSARAVLVLEASVDGRLKVARKGVGNYRLDITGRAAHAGLEPEKGANALIAAARLVLALEALADPELGTTVTPTLASAGSAQNTVPAKASVAIDVRASTVIEQERVDHALRCMETPAGITVDVEGGVNRPPMEQAAAAELMVLADRAAQLCGLPTPGSAQVGGGSDGNFTAALGIRTLDGLGAVGAGAHAEGEYVLTTAMPERAALLAALIVELEGEVL